MEARHAQYRLQLSAGEGEHGQLLECHDRGSAPVSVAQQSQLAEGVTRPQHGERGVVAVLGDHPYCGMPGLDQEEGPALVLGVHDRLVAAVAPSPAPATSASRAAGSIELSALETPPPAPAAPAATMRGGPSDDTFGRIERCGKIGESEHPATRRTIEVI